MKRFDFMKRSIAWVLCLAMSLSLPLGIASSGASATVVARVADEYENLYTEDYSTALAAAQRLTEAQRYTWNGFAWKGDEASSRIDIMTRNVAYDSVELVSSDLVDEATGATISKKNIAFTYLDDIEVIETMLPGSASNGKHLYDVITRKTEMAMEAGKLYSAWVAITVPVNAKAGDYHTTLSVVAGDQTLAEFDYNLTVYDMVQPELESYVDLWMWPYNSIRYYSGKSTEEFWGTETAADQVEWETLWNTHLDEKYFPALRSELELYAKAGGDTIFAQVNEKNRTNGDPYPSLVKWTREKDGSMSFDYTDFDKWVELNIECGIDKQIKCYDPGVFWNTMAYYDESKGEVRTQNDSTGGKIWQRFWGAFLEDFIKHLDEKGWFDITYIALDEKDINITKGVIDLVKQYTNKDGKNLKVATAVATYQCEEIFDDIADLSLAYGLSNGHMLRVIEDRNAKGLITTIYTCGPQGSSILNSPDESAMSIHDCYRQNDAGFLRWALQKYTADPLNDSYNYNEGLCAGDMYLIYPDYLGEGMQAQSTPRYEKLCEAIRDIEKAEYLEENLPELRLDIKNRLMTSKESDLFRSVIGEYSAVLDGGLAPVFGMNKDSYELLCGEVLNGILSEAALGICDQLADVTYMDEWDFTFSEGNWKGEGHYFKLFFCSTNHYTVSSAATAYYEFDFYGDSFELIGTQGTTYGKSNVYIDGDLVGTAEQYNTNGGRFRTIFASDNLELGEHHVKVESADSRSKHVDYAIIKQSADVSYSVSNENIIKVDEKGNLTAVNPGTATVYAECAGLKAQAKVTVKADLNALNDKIAALKEKIKEGYTDTVKSQVEAVIAEAEKVAASSPTLDKVDEAYQNLLAAEYSLIETVVIKNIPIMSTYVVGEEFTIAGGRLSVKYLDGTEETVEMTTDMVTAPDLFAEGEHSVEVTYAGKKASYTVKVNEPVDTVNVFDDVLEDKWYVDAVDYAVGHGLFNGVNAVRFGTSSPMTRGMLVTVLHRIEGTPAQRSADIHFDDVEEGKYYTAAVHWAASNGIVNGVSQGRFAPNNNVTREQLATILYRYSISRDFEVSANGDLSTFPDGDTTGSYAEEAMAWAVECGLVTGIKSGDVVLLSPKGNATRAQVATILQRYQQMIVG